MREDDSKGKARFWSVSNEDAEYTKHHIRHFILALKLGTNPIIDPQDMNRLQGMWVGRHSDDIKEREYRMLWQEAEKEIQDEQ